jgi:hypothetical protein
MKQFAPGTESPNCVTAVIAKQWLANCCKVYAWELGNSGHFVYLHLKERKQCEGKWNLTATFLGNSKYSACNFTYSNASVHETRSSAMGFPSRRPRRKFSVKDSCTQILHSRFSSCWTSGKTTGRTETNYCHMKAFTTVAFLRKRVITCVTT